MTEPYKKKEFKIFLASLKKGSQAHWQDIAEACGVEPDTITRWKKLPEAQYAIQQGIDEAIEQMSKVGGRDWRQWEAKLKMLGVNPATKVEHNIAEDSPANKLLKKFGLLDETEATESLSTSSKERS